MKLYFLNFDTNLQYFMNKANNKKHLLLFQYASPKKSTRLLSNFRSFYTKKVSTSPSLPQERGRYFSLTPNNKDIENSILDKQISKKRNVSQKMKTEQQAKFNQTAKSQQFHQTFQKLRKKSLRKMQLQALAQKKIKRKFGQKKKKGIDFIKYEDVPWIQKRWDTTGITGKHSQKMHPMCLIYEECAQKIVFNRFHTINPFQGYEYIQF